MVSEKKACGSCGLPLSLAQRDANTCPRCFDVLLTHVGPGARDALRRITGVETVEPNAAERCLESSGLVTIDDAFDGGAPTLRRIALTKRGFAVRTHLLAEWGPRWMRVPPPQEVRHG